MWTARWRKVFRWERLPTRSGPKYGAFASLGLTMNGILTALLTPLILEWIGVI